MHFDGRVPASSTITISVISNVPYLWPSNHRGDSGRRAGSISITFVPDILDANLHTPQRSRLRIDIRGTKINPHHHLQELIKPKQIHRALSSGPQKLPTSTMASPLTQRTNPLYQKDGQLYTHTSPISSFQPLSSLPSETQALFKPPHDAPSEPYILTTPSTIFHAQGGGQPSDTGLITSKAPAVTFQVHQVRKPSDDSAILHLGIFSPAGQRFEVDVDAEQKIDVEKRVLHSRIHTAGHVIGLAINSLMKDGKLPSELKDGKASHYPGAAFVEFSGLIPGEAKQLIQDRVDRTFYFYPLSLFFSLVLCVLY